MCVVFEGDFDDDMSDEFDEIDGVECIKEIDIDEEEVFKFVDIKKKGKKRVVEEEVEGFDELIVKDEKKNKKQKKNKSEVVIIEVKEFFFIKGDKKVQFVKNFE